MNVAQNPLVLAVLARFPAAKIVDVRKATPVAAVAIALTLAGCASSADAGASSASASPAAYRVGYADGCNSGRAAAGNVYMRFTKDVNRASADPLYRDGWRDGFDVCKGQGDAVNSMIR